MSCSPLCEESVLAVADGHIFGRCGTHRLCYKCTILITCFMHCPYLEIPRHGRKTGYRFGDSASQMWPTCIEMGRCVNRVRYVVMVEQTQRYILGNRQSFTIWRFLVFLHGRHKKIAPSCKPRSKINYLTFAPLTLGGYRTLERINEWYVLLA
jgi:hypothetical protein